MTVVRHRWMSPLGWILSILAGMISVSGCDSSSFVPPRPAELSKPPETSIGSLSGGTVPKSSGSRPDFPSSTAGKGNRRRPTGSGSARVIEMILAHHSDDDRHFLAMIMRRDAGKAKLSFRIAEPESGKSFSPGELAGAIRAAVEHGTAGLVVEPVEGPAVVDALHEAVEQGIPVLLLDRPIAPWGGKSIPCVRYTGYAEAGKQIVEATLDSVKLLKSTEPGRIVILHHRPANDFYAEERLRSLVDPLKAANRSFELIKFQGDANQAGDLLRNSLAADPKLDAVLADTSAGIIGAEKVLIERTNAGQSEFRFAGYFAYDYRTADGVMKKAEAFGDQSVETFSTKTFQAIQGLLDGKPMGGIVEIPIIVRRRQFVFIPTQK